MKYFVDKESYILKKIILVDNYRKKLDPRPPIVIINVLLDKSFFQIRKLNIIKKNMCYLPENYSKTQIDLWENPKHTTFTPITCEDAVINKKLNIKAHEAEKVGRSWCWQGGGVVALAGSSFLTCRCQLQPHFINNLHHASTSITHAIADCQHNSIQAYGTSPSIASKA